MERYSLYFISNISNDTCQQISFTNCLCHKQEDYGDLRSRISLLVTSLLAYACWGLFVNILKCEHSLKCALCWCFRYVNEMIQNHSDVNNSREIMLPQNELPQPICSCATLVHMFFMLIIFVFWIFLVAFIGYKIDDPEHLYLRWPTYYFYTSVMSLVVSTVSLVFNHTTDKGDVVVLYGILALGFVQIFCNLPNTSIPMDTVDHARRLISTEYTIFLWLCCFYSIFTFKYVLKTEVAIINAIGESHGENGQPYPQVNDSTFIQRCKNCFVLLKQEIMKSMSNAISICRRDYTNLQYTSLFQDDKINMCLRMFSFVWSSNLLREFLNLFVDYKNFCFFDVWNYLELYENKALLFNSIIVIVSFILSSLCQIEYYSVDRVHLTLGYVTFLLIIYYFRVTLIYQENRWLIFKLTEIITAHFFVIVGIWFLFYINEKRNERQRMAE